MGYRMMSGLPVVVKFFGRIFRGHFHPVLMKLNLSVVSQFYLGRLSISCGWLFPSATAWPIQSFIILKKDIQDLKSGGNHCFV